MPGDDRFPQPSVADEHTVAVSLLEENSESCDDGSQVNLTGAPSKPKPLLERPVVRALVLVGSLVALFTTVGLLSKQPAVSQAPVTAINDDGTTAVPAHRVNPDGTETKLRQFTFEEGVHGSPLVPRSASIEWLSKDGDDGYYLVQESGGAIVAKHVGDGDRRVVLLDPVNLPHGLSFSDYSLSPDWQYLLLTTDLRSVWRHSFTAEYVVFDVAKKTTRPLTGKSGDRLQYAQWSPKGHRVAYAKDANLYVTDLATPHALTTDGSEVILNGILDWVYEEEIFSGFRASWWSPDGECITYLRTDDTHVPLYTYPLYHPENRSATYTETMSIRYPKPGSPNPTASAHIACPRFEAEAKASRKPVQITFDEPFAADDAIFTDFKWVTETHDALFIRVMNRVQDHARLYLVDPATGKGRRVQETNNAKAKGGDGAWVETTNTIQFLPPGAAAQAAAGDKKATAARPADQPGYLDLVVHDDYLHLAFFATLDAAEPVRYLTSGAWGVVPQSVRVDMEHGWVYYTSTEQRSVQKHLYRVKLDGTAKTALTPPDPKSLQHETLRTRLNGTYSASFSAHCRYYLLHYRGPDAPWYKITSPSDPQFERVLEANDELVRRRAEYALPSIVYRTVEANGEKFNVQEIRPHGFSELDKHAVLFHPYGGPNSQQVNSAYSVDWHTALVSQTEEKSLKFIVVVVDGRGTGFRGRKFMTSVSEDLGRREAEDQIGVAKYYQTQPYVDATRLAIWGWSYGGYLTSKVIEADAGAAFKLGIAVAPVTHWQLYDTMYTERYMKTPQLNPKGYEVSGVNNMEGFKKAKFLLMHGTGDDNVHFQQSAFLVDSLTMASVQSYQVQYYVDSDHRNNHRNANGQLYDRLKTFLFTNFKAA
ncbi:Dpp4p [Tieghemiomyces parasiticus]|uniref:Dpp4p n=1 Tax=Tieghemiomyces parasiticus TaxID=78921 RepID=A0A9W8A2I2_9FUNG|nr:Dpp4p [Tieghemiomyces parasiticus]